jgi:hypothetical protein
VVGVKVTSPLAVAVVPSMLKEQAVAQQASSGAARR